MAPSEPESLPELARRLDGATPERRREVAGRIPKYLIEDLERWTELDDEVVDALAPHLDDDAPEVRSAAAFVLGHAVGYDPDGVTRDREALADRVLGLLDDDARRVRQVAAHPDHLGDVLDDVLSGEGFAPRSPAWFATTLLDMLAGDPAPIVRKRVTSVFDGHKLDLLDAHPDTGAALETLAETLGDPLDGLSSDYTAITTPREAALRTLREHADRDPEAVAAYLDEVRGLLSGGDRYRRNRAVGLLVELRDAGAVGLDAFAPAVVDALDRGEYPLFGADARALAVDVALAYPEAFDDVADGLLADVTVDRENPVADSAVEALARLVREGDRSFDPPVETLADLVDDDAVDAEGVDPYVLLATHHPEFVAEQLRAGYRKLVADELPMNPRFDGELVVAVADENLRAVEGVPELLAEAFDDTAVQRVLLALAEEHPRAVADAVPAAVGAVDWTPTVNRRVARFVEVTADAWESIPGEAVDALVGTVETGGDRHAARRRHAVRALVALHESGHGAVPDRVEPFVDPYHDGTFDEGPDGDAADPAGTDAAVEGGWIPGGDGE